jgi:hypothetical protein
MYSSRVLRGIIFLLISVIAKKIFAFIVQQIICHCPIMFGQLKSSPVGYLQRSEKIKVELNPPDNLREGNDA